MELSRANNPGQFFLLLSPRYPCNSIISVLLDVPASFLWRRASLCSKNDFMISLQIDSVTMYCQRLPHL